MVASSSMWPRNEIIQLHIITRDQKLEGAAAYRKVLSDIKNLNKVPV